MLDVWRYVEPGTAKEPDASDRSPGHRPADSELRTSPIVIVFANYG